MTSDDLLSHVERLIAAEDEERRKVRVENQAWSRTMQAQIDSTQRELDAFIREGRERDDRLAARIKEVDATLGQCIVATDTNLDARIAALVSAIGELVARDKKAPVN
jgi:hypothetical protein